MINTKITAATLTCLLLSTGAFAANVKITGTIPTTVNTQPKNSLFPPQPKHISLLKIELSEAAKNYLAARTNKTMSLRAAEIASDLPPYVQLAMNGVPVLDQGQHGTCVTFADSAALDAIYGHTDYVSQLCNLSLGSYLEQQDKNYQSGWDGTWNENVLGQIKKYGIINMTYQKQYGCGSTRILKEYPLNNEKDIGSPMLADEFTRHSEYIMKDIYTRTLENVDDALSPKVNMDSVLKKMKASINNGHRVVIGTLLDINGTLLKVNGADGTYHNVKNSAWIITPAINKDIQAKKINAGHAMVVTGYDDQAVITGSDGSRHEGVITLRNSWSSAAGESGNYFMSYEYFKMMVLEVVEISPTPLN